MVLATITVEADWLARYLDAQNGTATLDKVSRAVISEQRLGNPGWFLRKAVQEKLKELVGNHGSYSIGFGDGCLILEVAAGGSIPQAPCPSYPAPLGQPALFEMPRW